MAGDLTCLQTAKRSFTFASFLDQSAPAPGAQKVSKPLSGRSLLQEQN
jgi:hypothetical protein